MHSPFVWKRSAPWLVAAFSSLLTACPGGSGNPDAGADAGIQVSPVELCDRLAAARCELFARCHPAFQRDTASACRSLEQARCLEGYDVLRPAFEAKTVEIDGEKLLACEERMKSSACVPTFPPGVPGGGVRPFADCTLTGGLLRGKVPSGQTCEFPVECASGTLCIKPGGVCKGTCTAMAKEDEPCGFACAPDLFCDNQNTPTDFTDDRCAQLKGVDQPCTSSRQCTEALRCSGGTCQPRAKENEPCTFDANRLSTCEPGLVCDVAPYVTGASGTCKRPGELGATCRFHWSCGPGLVCAGLGYTNYPKSQPDVGTCALPTATGQPCSFTIYARYVGDQCAAGSYCARNTQTCTAIPELGGACVPSAQACAGLDVYCKPASSADQGTCARPAQIGETCAFQVDAERTLTIPCASGYCDKDTTLTCLAPNKAVGQPCQSNGECTSNRCVVQADQTFRCAAPCS